MAALRMALLAAQRRSFARMKRAVDQRLEPNEAVRRYEREYRRGLGSFERTATRAELIAAILRADIVFHGDYHTLVQSQHSAADMLEAIAGRRRGVVCLEAFCASDQPALDRYMRGSISEQSFLEATGFGAKWGYCWQGWKRVLAACRQAGMPVRGIDLRRECAGERLRKRDTHGAAAIATAMQAHPGALAYVVAGDFHIAPGHLPARLDELRASAPAPLRRVFVYQNIESLYWRLAQTGRCECDILRLSAGRYCLMNASPAEKMQSCLYWLEYPDEARGASGDTESGADGMGRAVVSGCIHRLFAVLGVSCPRGLFDRIEVHAGRGILDALAARAGRLGPLSPVIQDKIGRAAGCCIEYSVGGLPCYLVYAPGAGMSVAAEQAAHVCHAVLRGSPRPAARRFDRFYQIVMSECLAFCGARLLYQRFAPLSPGDVRRGGVEAGAPQRSREQRHVSAAARLVAAHHALARTGASKQRFADQFDLGYRLRGRTAAAFVARLGAAVGERLYRALLEGDESVDVLRGMFSKAWDAPDEAFGACLSLSRRGGRESRPAATRAGRPKSPQSRRRGAGGCSRHN